MAKTDEKEHEVEPESPDIHFEPLVKLSLVDNKTLEEEEDILLQLRARLYRYDRNAEPVEWKERGTGECKILKHKNTSYIRILMRRDKTLKICANHYIYPAMVLKPNCGSDRAWVWTTQADYADEEVKEEVLAIKFANAENAQKFKSVFEESAKEMKKLLEAKQSNGKDFDKSDVSKEETTENKEASSISSEKDKQTDEKENKETEVLTEKLEDLKVSGEDSKNVSEAAK
ncbi:ran binding protein 1 [Plakobranchus ocellatus]|uniref:Ran binding protein 1 n=1 Tax=Plakobranchus ocellatus TaxID=259542 RepID=A0AAV3YBU3_9GAST|nr:ran binding protein 1 [Plakobranchus ocellatus]